MPKFVEINPEMGFGEEQLADFLSFLEKNLALNHYFFKRGSTYSVPNDTSGLAFYFSASMLCRRIVTASSLSKDDAVVDEEECVQTMEGSEQSYTLDFIGDVLGSGEFAEVYNIDVSFNLRATDTNTIVISKLAATAQPRVIKAESSYLLGVSADGKVCHQQVELASQMSYNLQRSIRHLNVQPPVLQYFTDTSIEKAPYVPKRYKTGSVAVSYNVMNKISGETLALFLKKDRKNKGTLIDMDQRVNMTLELLTAYKEQVTDYGLLHGDIKPENIMFDEQSKKIRIIDYQFATKVPEHAMVMERCYGTPYYNPPEILINKRPCVNSKRDIFALGRILVQLWGGYDDNGFKCQDLQKYIAYVKTDLLKLESLFKGIPISASLDAELQKALRRFLEGLLALEPENRLSIDEAIENFSEIKMSFNKRHPLQIKSSPMRIRLDFCDQGIHGLSSVTSTFFCPSPQISPSRPQQGLSAVSDRSSSNNTSNLSAPETSFSS